MDKSFKLTEDLHDMFYLYMYIYATECVLEEDRNHHQSCNASHTSVYKRDLYNKFLFFKLLSREVRLLIC